MNKNIASAFVLFGFALLIPSAHSHVDWTQLNRIDSDIVGLYHFNDNIVNASATYPAAQGLPANRNLFIGAPQGEGFGLTVNVPKSLFQPYSLRFRSVQTLESPEDIHGLDGDLTIEFWYAWDPEMTECSVEIGLRSGAKIRLTRSLDDPSKDQCGIQATHGDFVSAPGFTNWEDVGEEEASLGEWRHIGITIHSTGMHFDEELGHDVYNDGSLARLYLNGHATGPDPHTIDLSRVQVHSHSKITIRNLIAGSIYIDDVAVWKKDWSENGAIANPFRDGRGSGVFQSSAVNWDLYE